MHIQPKVNLKIVCFHILFWLIYMLYWAISLGPGTEFFLSEFFDVNLITSLPTALAIAYFNYYFLFPNLYLEKRYTQYVLIIIIMLFAGGLFERFGANTFWIPWDKIHDPIKYRDVDLKGFWHPYLILRNTFKLIPAVIFGTFIRIILFVFIKEKDLRLLKEAKYKVEVEFLKGQINPHFFFNTLNELYALTMDTSIQASRIVLRLSKLMQYMLYQTSDSKVLIVDEIDFLEDFIAIEQLRHENHPDVSFMYSGDFNERMIGPLLLLPLIENAFKHGNSSPSGWVTINLKLNEDQLLLLVKNNYPDNKASNKPGLGISNLNKRLTLIYPGKFDLKLSAEPEYHEAILRLEL